MSLLPFILLFVGLILIFLEFYLPGAIMGITGGIVVFLSIVFFVIQAESVLLVLLYIVGVIILLLALVKFALWKIKKNKGIFLHTVQDGYLASEYPKELIGKKGEALSDLKPSGHILVEGKRYQAVARQGYIVEGSPIEVIGGEGAHLIVKKETTSL